MAIKQINVAEATGPALDWLVAKCEEVELNHIERDKAGGVWLWLDMDEDGRYVLYTPSTDWAQGGAIIDRMFAQGLRLHTAEYVTGMHDKKLIAASLDSPSGFSFGPTPLIAAMRCRVVSKLGDEVEVPEELV